MTNTKRPSRPAPKNNTGHAPQPKENGAGDRRLKQRPLLSMAHNLRLRVKIMGAVHPRYMPTISQGGDGMVPVVEVAHPTTGELAYLIVPMALSMFLSEEPDQGRGRVYTIEAGAVDAESGYRHLRIDGAKLVVEPREDAGWSDDEVPF